MMTTRRTFLALGLAAALGGCTSSVVRPAGSTSPLALSVGTITAQVNATRRHYGVAPLGYSSRLEAQARAQARLMAARGRMSHELGGSLRDRTVAAGYQGATGENLAMGQPTLEDTIEDWLASPGHRSILLGPRFTEFGLAAATGEGGRPYWALIAGGPFENWR